jgi:hypothetical protein
MKLNSIVFPLYPPALKGDWYQGLVPGIRPRSIAKSTDAQVSDIVFAYHHVYSPTWLGQTQNKIV